MSSQELQENIVLQERLIQAFITRDGEVARRAISYALTWTIGVLEAPIQRDDGSVPTAHSGTQGSSA